MFDIELVRDGIRQLTPNTWLELVYGYGSLDKFNITGGTQFFQTRIQFQL